MDHQQHHSPLEPIGRGEEVTQPTWSTGAGATQPSKVARAEETQPLKPARKESFLRRMGPWLVAIPASVILVTGGAAFAGYRAGQSEYQSRLTEWQVEELDMQFRLGTEDIEAERFELARQRFGYILGIDPSYPGAAAKLDEALRGLNPEAPTSTLTPTPSEATDTPSPTVEPTARGPSAEALFQSAREAMDAQDWSGALDILLELRAEYPDHRLDEVNQMMAESLQKRGLRKIHAGDQEGGIYDLNLAERFGPLDAKAESWRRSAAYYMVANSVYALDWGLAARYFGDLCKASLWDTCPKFKESAWSYGDQLMAAGKPCEAVVQYEASRLAGSGGAKAVKATQAYYACQTATAPVPTATDTPVPPPPTATSTPNG